MSLSSRIIVEDYILYRISDQLKISPILKSLNEDTNNQELKLSVRSLVAEYERRYKSNFPDIYNNIQNITTQDLPATLHKIALALFRLTPVSSKNQIIDSSINHKNLIYDDSQVCWGHVLGFLMLCGSLAVHALEKKAPEQVEVIIGWVSNFFDNQLRDWIDRNGGWKKMIQYSAGNRSLLTYGGYDYPDRASMQSFMSFGLLAACVGVGAMILGRK